VSENNTDLPEKIKIASPEVVVLKDDVDSPKNHTFPPP
jgi:hypothetical protein